MATRFILLTTQRSGSTWTSELIGTHGHISTTFNEPMNSFRKDVGGWKEWKQLPWERWEEEAEKAFAMERKLADERALAYG